MMPSCSSCPSRLAGVFRSLSPAHLASLEQAAVAHMYRVHQVVFYEGNPPLAVYCVQSGQVKLYKVGRDDAELVTSIPHRSELLGHCAVLAGEPYEVTAETLEPSTICAIPARTWLKLLAEVPGMAAELLGALARQVLSLEEELLSRTQEGVRQRAARLVLRLYGPAGDGEPASVGSHPGMPRSEMAHIIGTTPETLSRTLHELAREGVLELTRGKLTVLDIRALRKVVVDHEVS